MECENSRFILFSGVIYCIICNERPIFMEDNGLRFKRKISIDHWQTNRSAISDEKGKSKILKKM